ncbi:hypothetical protein SISNIDRAFT_410823 [Sistotremastrum niveocremeum HHB9708]|uniref:Multicopper oxidase n=1 Tax=Sistotremastrum niveocremeum HHB9708 TaxID=1314777 RepID=A0A164V540_9AGAM|nr:hypothetical protein SISNIDRAFT_410823 [Sistotremastrum niveocremeum HHB9708]
MTSTRAGLSIFCTIFVVVVWLNQRGITFGAVSDWFTSIREAALHEQAILKSWKPETSFESRLKPEDHAYHEPRTFVEDWVVREELRAPDGVQKPVLTVNGQFPGPTIELRSGDTLNLRVTNELPEETTAIHFHGIRLVGANSMDGTPGLTQCPITRGSHFWYNFTISEEQSGTFWWHSHSATQRADGLYGAFVVHKPSSSPKPPSINSHISDELKRKSHPIARRVDSLQASENPVEHILLIGDWYHDTATAMMKWYRSKTSHGYEPTPDIALFNGVNTFDCQRPIKKRICNSKNGERRFIRLDHEMPNRLRLVNTGMLADIEISIDNHLLVVIEADGTEVKPQKFRSVTVSPGQRYSVILEPLRRVRAGDSFTLRAAMSPEDFQVPNVELDLEQTAIVYYGSSPMRLKSPSAHNQASIAELPFSPEILSPLIPVVVPEPDVTYTLFVNSMRKDRLGGIPYGYVNQTSWKPDPWNPLILADAENIAKDEIRQDQLVVTTDRRDVKVVELIINNIDEGPHPFHLHGHHFWPLYTHRSTWGWGSYNTSSPPSLDHLSNSPPVLRDTYTIARRGYAIIRFRADAPGLWLFHCHVLVHLGTG